MVFFSVFLFIYLSFTSRLTLRLLGPTGLSKHYVEPITRGKLETLPGP